MAESSPIEPLSFIAERWPGLLDQDIQQGADFIRFCNANENEAFQDAVLALPGEDDDPLVDTVKTLARTFYRPYEGREGVDALREAVESYYSLDQYKVLEAIDAGQTDLAGQLLEGLVLKWKFGIKAYYEASPLFPDGRETTSPAQIKVGKFTHMPSGTELVMQHAWGERQVSKQIVEFLETQAYAQVHATASIEQYVEESLTIDPDYYDSLRKLYGTKAANLVILSEAYAKLKANSEHSSASPVDVEIPAFAPVATDLYAFYRSGDSRYKPYLEDIRQRALKLTQEAPDARVLPPLIAVRSSARFSEDRDGTSGAGVYDSVAVDPRDAPAFRRAVEQVFDSVNSEAAIAYRQEHDIEQEELMGLILQNYIEYRNRGTRGSAFGYIRSDDGKGQLIELVSNRTSVLYDKQKIEADLMNSDAAVDRTTSRWVVTALHTVPDHDKANASFVREGVYLAHMAVYAEKLFGRHVELEFVLDESGGSSVVQVRPIPKQPQQGEEIIFPEDLEPLVTCRAVGVGDLIATIRHNSDYEADEVELEYVDQESHRGNALGNYGKNTVLVIGYNDGHSGHIQMLARERGQICLFPEPLTKVPRELHNYVGHPGWDVEAVHHFRIVADGYKGAIYPVTSEYVEELRRAEHERELLLTRLAGGLKSLAEAKVEL